MVQLFAFQVITIMFAMFGLRSGTGLMFLSPVSGADYALVCSRCRRHLNFIAHGAMYYSGSDRICFCYKNWTLAAGTSAGCGALLADFDTRN